MLDVSYLYQTILFGKLLTLISGQTISSAENGRYINQGSTAIETMNIMITITVVNMVTPGDSPISQCSISNI